MTTTPTLIPHSMRASVLDSAHALRLEERAVPSPAADEVLIKVGAVGVCGSDVHYFREGRIGDFVVEQPMVLGHEAGGMIVAVGAVVDPARIGQRVSIEPQRSCRVCSYCKSGEYNLCPEIEFYATPPIDGAFAQYVTIQADFAYEIPDSMSDNAAALLEPLSVGIAAVQKAKITVGSSVLIAGAGPIGIIAAQVAKAFGAERVIVTDPAPGRRELALRLGATYAYDPSDPAAVDLRVNAFIDASGVSPAIRAGIRSVLPGGAAILVGMGEDDMVLPVSVITSREIVVTGIFRYHNTWPTAIHLVTSGQVDLDSLVSDVFTLDEVEAALEVNATPSSMKHVVRPND
jgi:L-iditol 2-dehydrogenase